MAKKNKKRCERKIILSDQLALKELRLEQNLTQKEAGEKLGLSSKSIGAIENGRVSLDRKRIEEFVVAYGLVYRDFVRAKRIIEKDGPKKKKRQFVRKVLKNEDRRSYQKIITKECRVLRSMRRQKKLTQEEAAKLCGYPRATIGHIENGRIEVSEERIMHMVGSYGYKFSEYQTVFEKEELRDEILEFCVAKIESLEEHKLNIVKSLLGNF